jgi:S-adenosylmethionine synthetase
VTGFPLVVEELREVPVARRRVELVERKGIGHPDTICDALVEAVSVDLGRMYLERVGAIPHYNIDKALLVAGQCRKGFGWGEVVRPMEFVIGDRATFEVDGTKLPVEETVRTAVARWTAEHLPRLRPDRDLQIRSVLAPGSAELRGIFGQVGRAIVSNDTSGASGHAPLSPTETLVLAVERFLNGFEFKAEFSDTGEDVKVFARREDHRLSLTIAMPLVAGASATERAYFQRKDAILAALGRRFGDAPFEIRWTLNNLDAPGRGEDGVYLTVTGTSAEDADSGQVGRGNRANGLIAFARPAGGEAAAGKNPVAHAGKVYSVLSHRLAHLIHARCPHVVQVYVHLAARIGEPVDRPWTAIQVVLADGVALPEVEEAIRQVIETELDRLPAFRSELIRGEHPVY